MMWIFLLSDTFIFSCFLLSYMTVRMSTTVPWPNPSEVFALHLFGQNIPLILIAIMTFVLITSSGTMAMAVNFGYRRDRRRTAILMIITAVLGATFVGMQAFEWTKLIMEGVRPWENPWSAPQFGSTFFMITGSHGTHVTIGVIFLLIVAKGLARRFRHGKARFLHQPQRPLRDRRDHGPVLAFRRPGLGLHLRVLLSVVRERWPTRSITPYQPDMRPPPPTTRGSSTRSSSTSWSGLALRPEHVFVSRRLLPPPGLPEVGPDPALHAAEGRVDRGRVHAHGVGAAGPMYAILLPPAVVLVFLGIMIFESNYTHLMRVFFFGAGAIGKLRPDRRGRLRTAHRSARETGSTVPHDARIGPVGSTFGIHPMLFVEAAHRSVRKTGSTFPHDALGPSRKTVGRQGDSACPPDPDRIHASRRNAARARAAARSVRVRSAAEGSFRPTAPRSGDRDASSHGRGSA